MKRIGPRDVRLAAENTVAYDEVARRKCLCDRLGGSLAETPHIYWVVVREVMFDSELEPMAKFRCINSTKA
jgi:hypothetical protein